ncbi:MAG: hypothetical protein PHS93_05100 [Candidatus Omnitrophica bacterium]|nr:hypothetical protein [Candidatus Omnitrophota bacterium]MDD5352530.1 hypothetical protein [Candidatus Omnitrophota bacterium]MDD5550128.1 hypothetical protein [Candidatus Omnitrophota bacterium]
MKDFFLIIVGYVIRFFYERIFDRGPKVVFNIEIIRGFNIPATQPSNPNIHLWQQSIYLTNWGKTPATNIVIPHRLIPFYLNVSVPAISKTRDDRPNRTITIASIAPGELVTITYLDYVDYSPTAIEGQIVYDQGVAREIPLLVTRYPNKWFIRTRRLFAIIGIAALIYFCYFKIPLYLQVIKTYCQTESK